jgi:hypothetical protein
LDEFEASLGSCLDDLFPVARKTEVLVIYIKYKDYKFNVDPEKKRKPEPLNLTVEGMKFLGNT